MGSNPINLGFRFLLELGSLVIFGYWGWTLGEGVSRYILAIILPLTAAILWGTFAVIDDPSRSGNAPIPVSGLFRLILELVFFGLAVMATFLSGKKPLAWILSGAVIVHYLISYDRVIWLLQQQVKRR